MTLIFQIFIVFHTFPVISHHLLPLKSWRNAPHIPSVIGNNEYVYTELVWCVVTSQKIKNLEIITKMHFLAPMLYHPKNETSCNWSFGPPWLEATTTTTTTPSNCNGLDQQFSLFPVHATGTANTTHYWSMKSCSWSLFSFTRWFVRIPWNVALFSFTSFSMITWLVVTTSIFLIGCSISFYNFPCFPI